MKKNIIKYILMTIMIIICIISFSYSAGTVGAQGGGDSSGTSLFSTIVDILNIVWLPFAIMAGKLFTNDLVYGHVFHMNTVLLNIWQFSRAVANFIIGFTFIVSLMLFFLGKLQDIFKLIGKLVVSSIVVNMSRFLVQVIVDLSTIFLVAVGSLPMHLMGQGSAPLEKIKYCSVIQIDPTEVGKNISEPKNITICKKGSIKKIEASKFFRQLNSLTGPLVFIGSSILNIDKNWNIDPGQVKGGTSIKKSSRIRNALHVMVVLLFVVPIVLLVVTGIVRVFWMWIYISFSPLIILDYIFGSKYIAGKNGKFKISNVIGLIFQPVLVVMAMGISVIVLATVQSSFIGGGSDNKVKKELGICKEKSLCIGKKPVVTMEGSLTKNFMKDLGGIMGYMIVTVITFAMMWGMLKMAFHSTEITSSIADSTFKFAEEGLKAVPIIPTAHGGIGLGAIQQFLNDKLIKKGFEEKAATQANSLISGIDEAFGVGKNSIGPAIATEYMNKLEGNKASYATIQRTYSEFLNKVKKEKGDVIPNVDEQFKNVTLRFMQLSLRKDNTVKTMLVHMGFEEKKINSLSANDLFANSNFRRYITGLIKKPGVLNGNNVMNTIYNNVVQSTADELNSTISNIN